LWKITKLLKTQQPLELEKKIITDLELFFIYVWLNLKKNNKILLNKISQRNLLAIYLVNFRVKSLISFQKFHFNLLVLLAGKKQTGGLTRVVGLQGRRASKKMCHLIKTIKAGGPAKRCASQLKKSFCLSSEPTATERTCLAVGQW
jgi:hypothetical protein